MTQQRTACPPARRRTARPQPLRLLARAVARLYPDRPVAASVRPGDRGALPGRPYAELPFLR